MLVAQLCLTLCDPMDCGLPDSSVHGIFQARILEWVAISHSRGLSRPGTDPALLASPALADRFLTTRATFEVEHLLIHKIVPKVLGYKEKGKQDLWQI